jgi:hypothetical protein
MCQVSPALPGCSAVLLTPPPSADICTIAPNSALCQVLSPPTASEPVKPVQQATNEIIKTVTTMQSPSVSQQPLSFLNASSGSSSDAASSGGSDAKVADAKSDTQSDDKAASKDVVVADKSGTKSEPAKKMYCN